MSMLRDLDHEKALKLLTCRPVDIDCHCLDQGNPSPIMAKRLPFRQSSRGELGLLVPEIFDQVLKLLDFESLANLRSTNYNCKVAVDGIREYVDVVALAPGALRVLRSTGTISLHSVCLIYQQLISSKCVLCNDYGPYFFLLTGDRCCFNCVNTQLRFRLIHHDRFAIFFDVFETDELETLFVHDVSDGEEGDLYAHDHLDSVARDMQQPLKYVRLEQVLEQATRLYGGKANLLTAVEDVRRNWYLSRYDPTPQPDPEKFFEVAGFFHPWLSLKGATPFPSLSLSTGKIERGRWCYACVGPYRVETPISPLDPALWYRDTQYNIRQPWEERVHWLCLNEVGMNAFGDDEFLEVHLETCLEAQKRLKVTLDGL